MKVFNVRNPKILRLIASNSFKVDYIMCIASYAITEKLFYIIIKILFAAMLYKHVPCHLNFKKTMKNTQINNGFPNCYSIACSYLYGSIKFQILNWLTRFSMPTTVPTLSGLGLI